ncbi:MAG: Mur ligase domain-containing protein, partial [Patescibacteria group bacterium]
MSINPSKIHLIGAGGIGVSVVGKWFLHHGKTVSGSDVTSGEQVEALRHLGAHVALGQSVENISEGLDLVIYSPAVPFENIERARARELGIIEMSYPEFLGEFAKDFTTIAVSGTHGKSTTTAMIGSILEAAGMDPTVIVGSKLPSWPDGNLRVGKSNLLVVEACEHLAGMLNIHPDVAVVTNIEMDHPDFYRDLAHVQETFEKWKSQSKTVIETGVEIGGLKLLIPGEFNLSNARLAAAAAKQLGVTDEVIVSALNSFPGLWRRFEKIGTYHGADIFSDYAHHPTAIKKTLEATKEFFPGRRIVLCFQPHQHARTKELFNEFIPSFDAADKIILAEIYAVTGRLKVDGEVSSNDLVCSIKRGNEFVEQIFSARMLMWLETKDNSA